MKDKPKHSRNPLTGLCGLQPPVKARRRTKAQAASQSPYGAMWFATHLPGWRRASERLVAIPLRGYVVCNRPPKAETVQARCEPGSQSPYGAMWFATSQLSLIAAMCSPSASQSPYGAMWFATDRVGEGFDKLKICRNPLTGLCGLQHGGHPPLPRGQGLDGSQSPYGAMWFATRR